MFAGIDKFFSWVAKLSANSGTRRFEQILNRDEG